MLVLTRKLQDQIRIGENITITILRVKGNTVRIGLDAPRDVRVMRGELPDFASDADMAPTVEIRDEGSEADTSESGNDEQASIDGFPVAPLTAVVRAKKQTRRTSQVASAELTHV